MEGNPKCSPGSEEAACLCSILCSLPLSIIPSYLVNRYMLVSFRTTLRRRYLVPAEHKVGEVVAAAGIAATAGHALVPYQCLQEPQSFQRHAHGGLGHVQARLCNPVQRGKCSALSTGAAVQIQQRDKGSGGQIIGQNVPADQSVAALPTEPEVAVGGIDQVVLLLAKVVAVTLEQVSLGAEFLHSLLGCGGAVLAEPGKSGKGNSYIPALPAS